MAFSVVGRLAGTMQSYSTTGRLAYINTDPHPSKSALIGICMRAMGVDLNDDQFVQYMARYLRMGVRVDSPGSRELEMNTAGGGVELDWNGRRRGVTRFDGKETFEAVMVHRYFIADGDFTFAMEGDRDLVTRIAAALIDPVHVPFLGRKAHLIEAPLSIFDGPVECELERSLSLEVVPYKFRRCPIHEGHIPVPTGPIEVILETDDVNGEMVMDNPISFQADPHQLGPRHVVRKWLSPTGGHE